LGVCFGGVVAVAVAVVVIVAVGAVVVGKPVGCGTGAVFVAVAVPWSFRSPASSSVAVGTVNVTVGGVVTVALPVPAVVWCDAKDHVARAAPTVMSSAPTPIAIRGSELRAGDACCGVVTGSFVEPPTAGGYDGRIGMGAGAYEGRTG
jgi:hypothetical protein